MFLRFNSCLFQEDGICKFWLNTGKCPNEAKCNYMVFSRSDSKFATRLNINNILLERVPVSKILGVWLSEDLSWARNTQEICIKAYSRMTLITKLKYLGVKTEDLIEVYILYIRSVIEYCSVAYHSRLTQVDENKLERIQRICLKVILGDMYINYESALEMSGLDTLFERRTKRCLDFAKKCTKHPKNKRLFPLNSRLHGQDQKSKEIFIVNWARTDAYKLSTIPYCQRLLNDNFSSK